ncbi:MAG: YfhO family protein [Candidatus Levyibacteriota bacterium]
MQRNKSFIIVTFLFAFITLLLFWKFFLRGQIPFPGDFLVAWYEPWKTNSITANGSITIAHKPIADDVFRQLYPYKTFIAQSIKNLQLPLWNPYNGAGMPFLASMHVGVLTPFNILFAILSPPIAWGLYISIQPFLILLFTYLFCRKIGFQKTTSIFTSIAFVFSGFVIVRFIFGEYIYTFSCLPLLLYLVECFFENEKVKKVFLIPFVIFFLFISGQPQIILYVLLFTISYIFYRFFSEKFSPSVILKLFFLFLLGFGFAAIQLLPTAELFLQSSISQQSSAFIFEKFLLHSQDIIPIFIPNYYGNPSTYNFWGNVDYIETISYIGLVPVFFAFFSFGKKLKHTIDLRIFLLFTTLISVISSLDWFGTRFFFSLPIPILATGVPTRIFSLTTFSIILLAGYGFEKWITKIKIAKADIARIALFFITISSIFIVALAYYMLHIPCRLGVLKACRIVPVRNTILELIFFAVAFLIFLIYKKWSWRFIPFFLILVIFSQGFYNSQKFLPFSVTGRVLPTTPLFSAIEKISQNNRIFGFDNATIKTDFATYFHYFDPQFYDPLYNKRYGELVAFANQGIIPNILPRSDVEIINTATVSASLQLRRQRLFDLLGVKYFVYKNNEHPSDQNEKVVWKDANWKIVENPTSLPKAYLVSDIISETNSIQILNLLFSTSFDPKKSVILEEKIKTIFSKHQTGKVTTQQYEPDTIKIKTNAGFASILVLSDNYYPGWKAFIDNHQTKIYRADYTFRAIEVPAGNHTITFFYQPISLIAGGIISLICLCIMVVFFVLETFFSSL